MVSVVTHILPGGSLLPRCSQRVGEVHLDQPQASSAAADTTFVRTYAQVSGASARESRLSGETQSRLFHRFCRSPVQESSACGIGRPHRLRHTDRTATGQLIESTDRTANIGFNDMVSTFGILKELRHRGIECPGEMSIVGYSDIPTADLGHPTTDPSPSPSITITWARRRPRSC